MYIFILYYYIFWDDGKGAKQSLISPNDATLYLTTNGRSFSRYISI